MRKILSLLLIVALPFCIFAEGQTESESITSEQVVKNAKYVFLFIGDGMAMTQINAAEAYLSARSGSAPGIEKLSFCKFPAQGLTTTYASNAFITDSAAAGTAIACGEKTESGVISMDPGKTRVLPTIAEMAKEAGMKVGIVSSVNLDHATPAVFYSHNKSRNNYYEINLAMANSSFDYFAGGMVRISKTPPGKETAHDVMKRRGFEIASTRTSFESLKPSDKQVYTFNHGFASNALNYTIDQNRENITLAEFTKKGIELLDNENGFFMMVEGGKIDWACHANDAASSIHDTIAFDDAVKEAVKFYNNHPNDTIIVVTGDHETGGLTLGFAGTKYKSAFTEIDKQKISYEAFNINILGPYKKDHSTNGKLVDFMPEIEKNFGLTNLSDYEKEQIQDAFARSMDLNKEKISDEQTYLLYGGYEPLTITLTHILNQRAGLAWTSYSHTGVPVQTFAIGPGNELFNGYYDNTDIFKKLVCIMNSNAIIALK